MYELLLSPWRPVVAYMHHGNKYIIMCKQIVVISQPFTLQNLKLLPFIYYGMLYILLYWAQHEKNQPKAVKFPSKTYIGKCYL